MQGYPRRRRRLSAVTLQYERVTSSVVAALLDPESERERGSEREGQRGRERKEGREGVRKGGGEGGGEGVREGGREVKRKRVCVTYPPKGP